jgi:hypothetical protein
MAVLKPRERLVYFRVSEDEFRQFVSVCEQGGARSLSDLARNAVQRLIADNNRQRGLEEYAEKMYQLETLIAKVTEQLHILNNRKDFVEALNGSLASLPQEAPAGFPAHRSGQEQQQEL